MSFTVPGNVLMIVCYELQAANLGILLKLKKKKKRLVHDVKSSYWN